jgi:hypothetical protein
MRKWLYVVITLVSLVLFCAIWFWKVDGTAGIETFNGTVDADGANLKIRVIAFRPAIIVSEGGQFPENVGDWAIAYNHRLPSQCRDFAHWRRFASDELANMIAPGGTFPAFPKIARQTGRIYTHYVEINLGDLNQICLIGQSEEIVGTGVLSPSVQVLVWEEGWKNHVKDETGLMSQISLADSDKLLSWLSARAAR